MDLAIFTKQISLGMNAGLNLQAILEIIGANYQAYSAVSERVLLNISRGSRLSEALAKEEEHFPPLYRNLVSVGESIGGLQLVFETLATWLESEGKILAQVKNALVYPLVVIFATIAIGLGLAVSVLPPFLEVLRELEGELPLPTKALVIAIELCQNPIAWIFMVVLSLAWWYSTREWLKQVEAQRNLESTLRMIPLAGVLVSHLALARLFLALQMTEQAGLDFRRGMRASAHASGSLILEEDLTLLIEAVEEGSSIAEYLKEQRHLYPADVVGMIEVGEQAGSLAKIYGLLGQSLERDVTHRLEVFLAVLEPLLLATVSLIAGGVILALILPLSSVLQTL